MNAVVVRPPDMRRAVATHTGPDPSGKRSSNRMDVTAGGQPCPRCQCPPPSRVDHSAPFNVPKAKVFRDVVLVPMALVRPSGSLGTYRAPMRSAVVGDEESPRAGIDCRRISGDIAYGSE